MTFHHVTNGTCVTGLLAAAGIPGSRSIWADPLYEGPVPGGMGDDELLDVRARYLAGTGADPVDPVNDLRRWRTVIEDHDSYDELILWFEHDLFDQLNLIQLLTWLRDRLRDLKPVSLVCIGSFPGRPHFKGLGELTPSELASLLNTRQPVSDAQYALAERAWRAFRGSTPEALEHLRQTETAALPYLAAALTRFLQEYPWTRDGLSRSERRLLQLAAGGTIDLRTAFPRMHDAEEAYYMTDLSLAAMAMDLARASTPLLIRTAPNRGTRALDASVTLTNAGRAALAGELDRIEHFGIDRWLGGVHLRGRAGVWRWDPVRDQIVAP
jgi:hypothetical protein